MSIKEVCSKSLIFHVHGRYERSVQVENRTKYAIILQRSQRAIRADPNRAKIKRLVSRID